MKLADQITDFVNAAFTGLWVQTSEADEAEREIIQHARQKKWKIAVWDVAAGLRLPGNGSTSPHESGTGDPLAALRALPALADDKGTAILVLHNFHRFLTSPEVIQTAFAQLVAGKQQRTFIVVLAPTVSIPVELEKLFVVLEHSLPDRQQLERIARDLTCDQPGDLPKGDDLQRVLDAAAGLTRYEAEGAFALSLTRRNAIRPEVIWELKAQTLKKNNLLTLHRGQENFASLGGLGNLKDFCRRALRPVQGQAAWCPSPGAIRHRRKCSFAKPSATKPVGPRSCLTLVLSWGAWSGSPRPTCGRPCASPTP